MVIVATMKAMFGNVQRQEIQKWNPRAKPKIEGLPSSLPSIEVSSKHAKVL